MKPTLITARRAYRFISSSLCGEKLPGCTVVERRGPSQTLKAQRHTSRLGAVEGHSGAGRKDVHHACGTVRGHLRDAARHGGKARSTGAGPDQAQRERPPGGTPPGAIPGGPPAATRGPGRRGGTHRRGACNPQSEDQTVRTGTQRGEVSASRPRPRLCPPPRRTGPIPRARSRSPSYEVRPKFFLMLAERTLPPSLSVW